MMEDLKEEGIVNKVGGRFKLSTLIQKRMVALNTGAAEIGLEMIRKGGQADPDGLAPRYIRRPEAEVAWEKRMQSR